MYNTDEREQLGCCEVTVYVHDGDRSMFICSLGMSLGPLLVSWS